MIRLRAGSFAAALIRASALLQRGPQTPNVVSPAGRCGRARAAQASQPPAQPLSQKCGFNPVFKESTGGHTWINCLNEFAPQLFQ